MDKQDIIAMADEAFDESSFTDAEVLRFAALVAAAEREWVGLTDEEIEDVWASCEPDWDDKVNVLTLASAIEAKLRKKNLL